MQAAEGAFVFLAPEKLHPHDKPLTYWVSEILSKQQEQDKCAVRSGHLSSRLATPDVSGIHRCGISVRKTVPVGNSPFDLAVRPDGTRVYVANWGFSGNSVSVINTATNAVITTVPVRAYHVHLAVTPDGRFLRLDRECKRGPEYSRHSSKSGGTKFLVRG